MERMASKKNQVNPLEVAPKRFKEAGAMQLNSWKKKLRASDWTATEATRAASADFTGVDDHDAKSG